MTPSKYLNGGTSPRITMAHGRRPNAHELTSVSTRIDESTMAHGRRPNAHELTSVSTRIDQDEQARRLQGRTAMDQTHPKPSRMDLNVTDNRKCVRQWHLNYTEDPKGAREWTERTRTSTTTRRLPQGRTRMDHQERTRMIPTAPLEKNSAARDLQCVRL